jgi:hypothetical protein
VKTEIDIVIDIARRFDRLGISYMLTGSIAMNYYAEPRMTRDIDIVVEAGNADTTRMVDTLSDDYYVDAEAVREAIKHKSMFNVLHLDSVIKVDMIIRKSSEYRKVEFDRRNRILLDGENIFMVSKEDLILSKLYWALDSHSEMQMNDVKNLIRTGCDRNYIEKWSEQLGVYSLYKECIYG